MKARRLQFATAMALIASQAHAAKIPQLDPTWMPSQLFWLVLSFTTLVILVKSSIHPRVRDVLATRDNAIASALKEAEQLKTSAESAKSSFEAAGADARAEASALIAKTQAAINASTADEQAKLDALLSTKIADAEKSAKAATVKALAAVAQPTASLVQAMAGKLLGRDVTSGDAESAVKKVA